MSTRNQRYARFAAARRQWGPTKADEEIAALGQLADEGFDPKNEKEAALGISERAKANRAARGKMVYDQAQGRLVAADRGKEETERAVQRLGLSAEDYWERNPESKRTAVNTRGETVDVMDMARERQAERADRQNKLAAARKAGRDRGLEMEEEQLSARLKEKGISPEAAATKVEKTYLDELAGTKGTRTGFDANKARGMLAQKTFDDWDYDKRLARDAVRAERDARGQLSDLRRKERRGAATAEDRLAMRDLESSIETGEQERDGLLPGYWRSVAEDEARNKVAGIERSRILAESQEKQADAVRKRTEALGRSLTAEELQQFGYPSWDDEAAWQELIKANPAAAEVYKTKPVKVSRAGRAMSKALAAFV